MSERSTPNDGLLMRGVRRLLGRDELKQTPRQNGARPNDAPPPDASISARLDAIERGLNSVERQLRAGIAVPAAASDTADDGLAVVERALGALEKQINRAGREQLKANSLAETQLEQLTAALEALRTADARREAEMATLREQSRAAVAAGRRDVVRGILPVLDSLDEALRSGEELLQHPPVHSPPRTLLQRLRRKPAPPAEDRPLRDAMAAWLVGLTFVRQRLLDLLASEGVEPMQVEGRPFDPEHHVVLDVVPAGPDLPPGTVASELRRGYLVDGRVLRHAEVVVARE